MTQDRAAEIAAHFFGPHHPMGRTLCADIAAALTAAREEGKHEGLECAAQFLENTLNTDWFVRRIRALAAKEKANT